MYPYVTELQHPLDKPYFFPHFRRVLEKRRILYPMSRNFCENLVFLKYSLVKFITYVAET